MNASQRPQRLGLHAAPRASADVLGEPATREGPHRPCVFVWGGGSVCRNVVLISLPTRPLPTWATYVSYRSCSKERVVIVTSRAYGREADLPPCTTRLVRAPRRGQRKDGGRGFCPPHLNEVKHARGRYPEVELFVVWRIQLERQGTGNLAKRGADPRSLPLGCEGGNAARRDLLMSTRFLPEGRGRLRGREDRP